MHNCLAKGTVTFALALIFKTFNNPPYNDGCKKWWDTLRRPVLTAANTEANIHISGKDPRNGRIVLMTKSSDFGTHNLQL